MVLPSHVLRPPQPSPGLSPAHDRHQLALGIGPASLQPLLEPRRAALAAAACPPPTPLPPRAAARRAAATESNGASAAAEPEPVVKICNEDDPFATIVTIEYGDRLGELLDTVGAGWWMVDGCWRIGAGC